VPLGTIARGRSSRRVVSFSERPDFCERYVNLS